MAKDQISPLKLEDLYAQIDKGKIDPVYFINGDEEYARIELLKLLRRKLFGDSGATASVEKITATAGSAPKIIDTASDYSLFSGGRLVIVYDIQRLSEKGRKMLVDYLKEIPQGNHLVLFGPASFDKRVKFYKSLITEAVWSTLTGLNDRSAPFWIKKRLNKYGIAPEPKAIELLLKFVGNSYGLLANQLDKIAIAIGEKKTLTAEDVKNHTAVAAEYDIFKLLDFIEQADRTSALIVLKKLLERSDGIRTVLFWLGRQYWMYYKIAAANKSGERIGAADLGTSPYIFGKLRDTASRMKMTDIEEAVEAVTEAEISIRFDHIRPELLLESLVIKLTSTN